jgi:hypothetical protein
MIYAPGRPAISSVDSLGGVTAGAGAEAATCGSSGGRQAAIGSRSPLASKAGSDLESLSCPPAARPIISDSSRPPSISGWARGSTCR